MAILGDPFVRPSLGDMREDFGTTGNRACLHIGHREALHCSGRLNARGRSGVDGYWDYCRISIGQLFIRKGVDLFPGSHQRTRDRYAFFSKVLCTIDL
jgi:hypothetical protein